MAMLEVKDLQVYYGMIQAIKGISFEVNQGEVIALIGANGAGKTTTLHTVTGLISPKSGQVLFEGKDITKTPAHKIVSMGMAHVPEGRRVFAELSVYENLRMGAYTRKDKAEIEETLKSVYKRFPRLQERKNQMAGTLSGGEQQMLAMGRALMSKPRIILMDEPSMGLSPIMVNEIFDIIRAVSESGTTVLLVEQNAKKALSIADRAYVLETGKIVLSGDAKELLEDEKELSEHNMLVDLGRNDIGKIAAFDSVEVTEYKMIHRYSKIMHICSQVEGDIRPGLDGCSAIEALLPAGTLSGAPKIRACQIIEELEQVPRGIYGGALGYLDFTGNLDTCIAIRMAVKQGGKVTVQAGGGIVMDSVPENEYEESANKARAVINAIINAGEVNDR